MGADRNCAAVIAESKREVSTRGESASGRVRDYPSRHESEELVKGMSIGAGIALILALLIAGSPLLLLTDAGPEGGAEAGWVFLFITIPAGALIGLVALGLSVTVSIIGISRARGTSASHLVIAIAALVLMVLSTGVFIALVQSMNEIWLLAFAAMGLVGFVLAIITGFIAPAKPASVAGDAAANEAGPSLG
jgi:hypothetical protein